MVSNNDTGKYHYHIQFFGDSINMEYKLLKIYSVCMSGFRLSSAIREARIAFGNDLTGMEMEIGGDCGESLMRPRGALCGCCENTLLWDIKFQWNRIE